MIRIPTHRSPTHPGEMLLEEFLKPMELTQKELAAAIHVPYQRVNEIVNGKRGITPGTALRLSKVFGGSGATGFLDRGKTAVALPVPGGGISSAARGHAIPFTPGARACCVRAAIRRQPIGAEAATRP